MVSAFIHDGYIYSIDANGNTKRECPVSYCGFFKERPLRSVGMTSYRQDGDYVRVEFKDWQSRRNWLDTHEKVESFETDVGAIRRFISDDHSVTIDRPRRAYLDIETDSRVPFDRKEETRILSWALVDQYGVATHGLLKDDNDNDEYRIICELWDVLRKYQQVCAWNGDGFDFPVILARTKKYNLWPMARKWMLWLDHMLAYKRMNAHAADSGEEKRSYALENIAQHVLGEGKKDVKGWKTWQLWKDNPEALLEYNIQDTALLKKIEEKKPFLELFQTLCEVTYCFPNTHSLKPSPQVDGYMLRMASKMGTRLPTKKYNDAVKFKGAYVRKPEANGIQKNIHVGDFASFYPSIMRCFNLSPEMKDPEGSIVSPTGLRTKGERPGMLCLALIELMNLREVWKQRRAAAEVDSEEWSLAGRMSDSYKTAINSFYGILGNEYSRYYDRDIAETVTQNAVYFIKKTIEAAEARGWKCIYTDTDSVFVIGPTREEWIEFVKWCNSTLYPPLLESMGCIERIVKLDYEKTWGRLIFPLSNGGDPVSKRMVGWYSVYKGKILPELSKPEIKGLEFKRGDSLRLGVEMQLDAVALLKTCDDPSVAHQLVSDWMQRIFNEPLDVEDVTLSKAISMDLDDYKIQNAPHVRRAKAMLESGEEITIGTRVEYILVDSTKSPAIIIRPEDYDGRCDRRALWNKMIAPPTLRLLAGAFPDQNWTNYIVSRHKEAPEEQLRLF